MLCNAFSCALPVLSVVLAVQIQRGNGVMRQQVRAGWLAAVQQFHGADWAAGQRSGSHAFGQLEINGQVHCQGVEVFGIEGDGLALVLGVVQQVALVGTQPHEDGAHDGIGVAGVVQKQQAQGGRVLSSFVAEGLVPITPPVTWLSHMAV